MLYLNGSAVELGEQEERGPESRWGRPVVKYSRPAGRDCWLGQWAGTVGRDCGPGTRGRAGNGSLSTKPALVPARPLDAKACIVGGGQEPGKLPGPMVHTSLDLIGGAGLGAVRPASGANPWQLQRHECLLGPSQNSATGTHSAAVSYRPKALA